MLAQPKGAGRRRDALAAFCFLAAALLVLGCSPARTKSASTRDSTALAGEDSSLIHVEDPIPPDLLAGVGQPWTGDFDGMVERRIIRVLVVYNQTNYFFDGLRPRGLTYDALVEFERMLNSSLRKKLDTGTPPVPSYDV